MRMSKRVSIALAMVLIGLLAGIVPALAQDGGEELTETFVTSDGTISLKYPAGWGIHTPYFADMIVFSNIPGTLVEENGEAVMEGSVLVYLFGPQSAAMVFSEGLPASLDEAVEYVVQMAAEAEEDEEVPELSAPEDLTLGGYAAVRIGVSTAEAEGSMVLIDFGGQLAVASITTIPGELLLFEEPVMAILDTLAYAAPTGPLTFTSDNGALTLDYPPGWVALDMQIVAVASSYNAIQFEDEEAAAPGTTMLLIYPPDIFSVLIAEAKNTIEVAAFLANYWVPDEIEETVSKSVPVTVGEHEGVRIDFTTANDQGYVVALDLDGQIVAVLVRVAVGELADYEAAVQPILESIRYTPVEEETTP